MHILLAPRPPRRQRSSAKWASDVDKSQQPWLAGIRDVIDVTLRGEFHGSCADSMRNGEVSYTDLNGVARSMQPSKRNSTTTNTTTTSATSSSVFFLPAVTTTSGRISGYFLRLLYILSHRQAANFFTRMGIPDFSTKAYKQRRDTYFYYNRADTDSPAPRSPL
jgi:hypothetical protein